MRSLMYFKKLEIIGFKSFADKTTLIFEPGITAIVGPNGCGKSNIFDSIRWVLGEQSIKSLRGSKMEDVIFNGTENKPPLNLAEVSLTFSNESKFLPTDYDEVTITRRIFRSGESEYLLNKTVVRLKDIIDLIAGTGIGAESYSLVEQGKIDLVLSSRPEDRRLVFDEAAGVTKYKSKKKEALRRLEDTENNLLRVSDIIAEVKRQISSLDRQANKARRYKEEFDKLKDLDIKFSKRQILELDNEISDYLVKIESLKKEEIDNNTKLSDLDSQIHQLRKRTQEIEAEINRVKTEEYALISLVDKNTEFIKMNQERILELNSRTDSLKEQEIGLQARLKENQEKVDMLSEELSGLSKNFQDKDLDLKEKEKNLEALIAEIKNAHNNISQSKLDILSIAQKQALLNNDLSDIGMRISNITSRKKRLIIEKEKIDQEKSSLDEQVLVLKAEFDELNTKISILRQDEARHKESLDNTEESIRLLEETAQNLENQRVSLESQLEFLEQLKLKYEDISEVFDGILIVDKLPQGELSGILSKVKEIRQIDSGKYQITCELKPIPLDTQKIKEKINKIGEELSSFRSKIGVEKQSLSAIKSGLINIGDNIHQEEISLNAKKTNLQALEQQLEKICQEAGVIALEYDESNADLDSSNLKYSELKMEGVNLENKRNESESLITGLQEKIAKNNEVKEEMTVAIARCGAEINSLDDRKTALFNSLKLMQGALSNDQSSLERISQEIQTSFIRSGELAKESQNLNNQVVKAGLDKQGVAEELDILRKRFEEAAEEEMQKDQALSLVRNELDRIKNGIHQLSMQDKDIEFKKSTIKERLSQSYRINLDELPLVDEDFDRQKVSEEIGELRAKIEKMGTVNLVAIEEYDELKQRFEFLTSQQNDLISAKESLKEAINKINKTTKQLFLETFAKVGEQFKIYFRLLFGGGEAQLMLIDENDVLESGIEIIARPPGKKLQNVMLLSGGEKSLSAIALIFAVFKIKPSPFCVLDEIDAALDESNVDRFNRLLQEFIETSQFLVITHNKKTITAADVMYGITMQERGVSKIISAKLKERNSSKEEVITQPEEEAPEAEAPAEAK
ncbi:MAG: hypothetical protein COV72_08880 [Candidatus Omnitrophica bacterium CG11_big_fil_rev_8_21_14_0_20_42_13]|uniref:Chromosome partition protein Smc n=1 Tax=Candidatus Ghiorseimicrobium undicola TaxID=1974746 RepID=A0A2H0LVN0_9BACT|nr:MAG: hypothetical protein COV72_08880 [Candidatus Omnitrophica bacterium CG11_big_fil_rev_8_21_14_0_20_42_13]